MDEGRGKNVTIILSSEEEDYDDDTEEESSDRDEESESDYIDIDDDDEEEKEYYDRDEASRSDDESLSNKVSALLQGFYFFQIKINNGVLIETVSFTSMFVFSGGKDIDSLKLNECKAYLRKQGLRLAGNRAVCVARIKEHWR